MHTKFAKWIAVSGMDGGGKTSLVEALSEYYKEKGLRVYKFQFPFNKAQVLEEIETSGKGTPHGNIRLDRLAFATDYLFGLEKIALLMEAKEYDIYISQRFGSANFIFGAAQEESYEETQLLLGLNSES